MSSLFPAGPDGKTEQGIWLLVGASRKEQKTLFLFKGIPGHINPKTLPDVTYTYCIDREESLDLQGSSGTYHMLFNFLFLMKHLLRGSPLRSLGINLLPIGFSRGGACWCFISHDTYRQAHQSQDDVPVRALTQD